MKSHFLASATACLLLSAGAALSATASWTTASGGNGHTYEIVIESLSWEAARGAATTLTFSGESGYLATITSAEEQAFVDQLYMPRTIVELPVGEDGELGPISSLWLGGSDEEEEGVWKWVTGPESGMLLSEGYTNWDIGEPNDFTGEDYLAGWFRTERGDVWNDLPNNAQTDAGSYVVGYLVEYDTTVVPLPAGAWLMLSGIGALALARRRKRSS